MQQPPQARDLLGYAGSSPQRHPVARRGRCDRHGQRQPLRSRRLRLDPPHRYGAARRPRHRIGLGAGEPGSRSAAGHSYGGFKQSGIGREFSLEGMLDSFTQRQNVTVNLNTPSRQ